jgi:hypothetical protein
LSLRGTPQRQPGDDVGVTGLSDDDRDDRGEGDVDPRDLVAGEGDLVECKMGSPE